MKRKSVCLAGWCFAILTAASAAVAGDWAAWRGSYENGVSLETGLTNSTKDILWRIPYGGHSTPVIADGRIYAVNLTGAGVTEQEQIFCLDAADGHEIWHYNFNCFHTDVPDFRIGWASLAVDPETGNIYANGEQGMILCLSRDGKLLWSKSSMELYGRVSGYGGRTYTPLIDEDRVIVAFNNSSFGSLAPGAHRFLALDKKNGDILWWSTPGGRPEDPTYSNPVVAVIGGQRLLIAGNADGFVYAIKSRTGEKVWGFHASLRGLNASPVVDDYRVYVTHSEENLDSKIMGRVVCVDGRGQGDITKTGEIWRRDSSFPDIIDDGIASPLLHGGRLYLMSNKGRLFCLDALTGKQIWKFDAGRRSEGSPVWADGKIYLTTHEATFLILEDTGDSCKLIDKLNFKAGAAKNVEIYASPAISDGRIVIFTTTEMVCFGKKDAKPQPTPAEKLAAEAAPEKTPATMLVRPAEVLLRPGEKAQFESIAYDKHGQRIGPVAATYVLPAKLGSLDANGTFTAGNHGGIGEVRAELGSGAGKLVGAARVRVVPELPISEDFEAYKDGDIVGWWAGVSKAKYAVETLDGSKVLKKISNDSGPVLNRSLAFITPPIEAGYTVEADVRGARRNGTVELRGDAGVVNARYVLEAYQNGAKLRVVSWVPGPRFEKAIDFNWPADKWFRLKLKVVIADEGGNKVGKIYAKAWPRGEPEPTLWTIEATDPLPNQEGAAGIYAYSSNAEVYFDNIKIYR